MKSFGCNAIRTSHNPPAPELLDLCDQMGMLVMDEAFDEWKENKRTYGYASIFDAWSEPDLVSMLDRDRNHPSIVLYSIGNEIMEGREGKPEAGATAARLVAICHREDPTRPVTSACPGPEADWNSGLARRSMFLVSTTTSAGTGEITRPPKRRPSRATSATTGSFRWSAARPVRRWIPVGNTV